MHVSAAAFEPLKPCCPSEAHLSKDGLNGARPLTPPCVGHNAEAALHTSQHKHCSVVCPMRSQHGAWAVQPDFRACHGHVACRAGRQDRIPLSGTTCPESDLWHAVADYDWVIRPPCATTCTHAKLCSVCEASKMSRESQQHEDNVAHHVVAAAHDGYEGAGLAGGPHRSNVCIGLLQAELHIHGLGLGLLSFLQ